MDDQENIRMQCLHLAVSRVNAANQGDYPDRDAVALAEKYAAFVSSPNTPIVAARPKNDEIPF